MRQVRIANGTVRAAIAALVVMSASGARGDERPALHLFHEVGFALSFPTGVVTALSYAPTVSAFDGRLNVALGARFSANFDGGGVPYPNGSADLLAAGAHHVLTVARPRTQALNLMFGLSGRLYRGLEAGLDIDLVLAEKSVRQKRLERRCVRRVRSERVEPALGIPRRDEVRVPDAARAGSRESGAAAAGRAPDPDPRRAAATTRGVGPDFLGHSLAAVGGVEERPRHRGARQRRLFAPGRVQALLEE